MRYWNIRQVVEIMRNVLFMTSGSAGNRKAFSGTSFYSSKALEKKVERLIQFKGVGSFVLPFAYVASSLLRRFFRYNYNWRHTLIISREKGRSISRRIRGGGYDLIVAMAASAEIAFLETDVPIIYISDTTFSLMNDYYHTYTNLSEFSLREGNEIERRAVEKARFLVYPSRWAADSAVKDYGADPDKIRIIPYGANLDEAPSPDVADGRDLKGECRLLFPAREWERKGGDVAFETLIKLKESGISAKLFAVGCKAPRGFKDADFVNFDYIDKSKTGGRDKWFNLFADSHFLLLPTRMDCSPIVFAEAGAFGLPSISADTGGVSGMVTEGVNGFLLDKDAGAGEYAEVIMKIFKDRKRYVELSQSSRRNYEEKLNWDSWAKEVKKLIDKLG